MANMSYCRFQNTLKDLRDCFEAMVNEEELSPVEAEAKEQLIGLCLDIAQDFGDLDFLLDN